MTQEALLSESTPDLDVARSLLGGGRTRASKWVSDTDPDRQLRKARAFCAALTEAYWETIQESTPQERADLPPLIKPYRTAELSAQGNTLANQLGGVASRLPPIEAGFQIGSIYTALLPKKFQSQHGVYYTPPALTQRLLDVAENAGVDWASDTVLDPACGGGAFLAPVAMRMKDALSDAAPEEVLDHIATHLSGYEIDAFGAWMSRVTLEAALLDVCKEAGRRLPNVVEVKDSLGCAEQDASFNLVVGNPPYGKIKLSPERRSVYDRSLFGHANVYGLFTDLALRLTSSTGRVAYVTPTSFLAGKYFKALRKLLGEKAPPTHIDFLAARKGVFADVLQETLIAVYDKSASPSDRATATVVTPISEDALEVEELGTFVLPSRPSQPWIIPRSASQASIVEGMQNMETRIGDYGYQISTGPLVWNRHKDQLRSASGSGTYPLVWAECVTADGQFVFRAEKKNHEPYFHPEDEEDWLIVRRACVLVQRTTAKEQSRRLVAAELPQSFIDENGGVVVENHLNMVYAEDPNVDVTPRALTALLNSDVVDLAFRCISGSVAVSAYEMEALPLPNIDVLREADECLSSGASREDIEALFREAYHAS